MSARQGLPPGGIFLPGRNVGRNNQSGTERDGLSIQYVPSSTPMYDGEGFTAVAENLNRTWLIFFEKMAGVAQALANTGFLPHRTLDLKNTAVSNDVGDDTVIYVPGTVLSVVAALRTTIASDLTARLNVWKAGVSSEVGTFTIPSATAAHTALEFTVAGSPALFTEINLEYLDVLSWDVTASDGSINAAGVATFTVLWEPFPPEEA